MERNNSSREIDLFDEMVECTKYAIENPFFFYEFGESKEDWITNLIWKNKQNKELHPFLEFNKKKNQLGYKIIIYLICQFYLPRFDFKSVKLLLKAINTKSSSSRWLRIKNWFSKIINYAPTSKKDGKSVPSITRSTIKVIIPSLIVWFAYSGGVFNWSLFESISFPLTFENWQYIIKSDKPPVPVVDVQYNSVLGIAEFVSIAIIIFFIVRVFVKHNTIYLLSPRLFIGIIVGYIPIMAESTFMNLAVSSSIGKSVWVIIFLAAASLTFTYLYLRFEVRKGTGSEDNILIRKRTLNIFSIGVLYSFMLGLVIIDLFTSVYFQSALSAGIIDKLESGQRFHAAIFGVIDPLMVLFYSPLALFIGVVIQFIWEEKPITHPIK